jgi:solute carrier family 10 (sodium/bile acid cotransporter), member 7
MLCAEHYYRSTFSGAFETGAIYQLPTSSVVFNVLMNVAEYLLLTAFCYYMASPPRSVVRVINARVVDSKAGNRLPPIVRRMVTVRRMAPDQVVAVCFCGAAKTTSLGIPLIAAMWSQLDNFTIASIQVPVLLYTVEQVFVAQFLTLVFKHWLSRTREPADNETAVTGQDELPPSSGKGANTDNEQNDGSVMSGGKVMPKQVDEDKISREH